MASSTRSSMATETVDAGSKVAGTDHAPAVSLAACWASVLGMATAAVVQAMGVDMDEATATVFAAEIGTDEMAPQTTGAPLP
jgi:hypothetical protein